MASGQNRRRRGAAIGYLLKAFPVVSETFILNEVRALEALGVPLALLSLKRVEQPVTHGGVAEVRGPLLYAPWPGSRRLPALARAHLTVAARHPRVYAVIAWKEIGRAAIRWLRRPDRGRWRGFAKRVRRLAWAGWVCAEVERRGIRHLHAHYCAEPLRVADLVRKLAGVTYSFAGHAKDLYTAPPQRLRRRLRTAEFAVACHRHGEATLRRLAGPEHADKVTRIPHGLDTGLFRPGAGRRDPSLILAVGRLTPKKGFDTLIRACSLLVAEGRDVRCEIYGEGALKGKLSALIRESGLTRRVRLRSFRSQEDLPALYRRAALVALPCRELTDGNRDGVPNVVLEALACGAAVVASRAAGIPEAVRDGENGLLVPPDDAPALARAAGRLLEDPALAERLGRRAAAELADLEFRRTNAALADRFRPYLALTAAEALDRADRHAWSAKGMAKRAKRRLGVKPRRMERVEAAIRRAVVPGIEANAWRPDLERLATRRLWDEAIKAARLPRLEAMLNGSGKLGGPILDLGCGRGGLSVALSAHGHRVVALDLRFRNCAVTGWRGQRYGLAVPAVASVGERLPFPDASFPAVCCLEVLEHVADPLQLLREIRRVLAPGGACALTVINRWGHLDPHYHLWGINFLPRSWARRYIELRRRTTRSYRDCQTLDERHYYSFRAFRRRAAEIGFQMVDPEVPERPLARTVHSLSRASSLGFNSALLVLRPA
jgi:glycosyltransferase involved in cell wall biosynthesis/2-polyprenyl-3-methyl-5-hydroxy-6-metoxy-1,4-benzoquinol methylase